MMKAFNLGYPRIGERRELKRALEGFWKGKASQADLEQAGRELRARHWRIQLDAGIDLIPSNDFSFYDGMLDTALLFGAVPARFAAFGGGSPWERMFALARGADGNAPLELSKWFDTNYHYLKPEWESKTRFELGDNKPLRDYQEARALGVETVPTLIGPVSFLLLGKSAEDRFSPLRLLPSLLEPYGEVVRSLAAAGAETIVIQEPCLAGDLSAEAKQAYQAALAAVRASAGGVRLVLATYFDSLGENTPLAVSLPIDVLHVDLTRSPEQLPAVIDAGPAHLIYSLGVVDGRNVWRTDFDASLQLIRAAVDRVGPERVWLAPSCSLLHVPADLRQEEELDPEIRSWLAFARQKLDEVVALARLAEAGAGAAPQPALAENRAAKAARRSSDRVHRPEVAEQLAAVRPDWGRRSAEFSQRYPDQCERLRLPRFPTTTIGSFPQTEEIRAARAAHRTGTWSSPRYRKFLQEKTAELVRLQEDWGLDVLVHGEYERNDMVEYFGEQLEGFAFTRHGWVQSYGSRCVKPPILFGDVRRPAPITVDWSTYAQSLTGRPVKGMLTGPVTLLQWSFVRDDQPRSATALQLALAIRGEVLDLERAGIGVIQIDEPALREGLPLWRAGRADYLQWAVFAFRVASAGVASTTQIHTHMCYADFEEILPAIAALDADVISIESSRSNMELLQAFADFRYPNAVGPGIWDIHSPRIPPVEEMLALLRKARGVVGAERLWVNPDCGLKTRGWPETEASILHLVRAAELLRHES